MSLGYVPQGQFRAQQKTCGSSQQVAERQVDSGESRKPGEIVDRRGIGFGEHLRRQG